MYFHELINTQTRRTKIEIRLASVCTQDGRTFHKIYTYIKVSLCMNVVRDFNQPPWLKSNRSLFDSRLVADGDAIN